MKIIKVLQPDGVPASVFKPRQYVLLELENGERVGATLDYEAPAYTAARPQPVRGGSLF